MAALIFGAATQSVADAQSASEPSTSEGAVPRIIGGVAAPIEDFPYFVYLTDRDDAWRCGGTLIRPRWVLTAAHCVAGLDDRDVVAYLGYDKKRQHQVIRSSRIEIHPNYAIDYQDGRLRSITNDVALVRLSKPAKTGRAAIAVTGLGRNPRLASVGSAQTIIGWGLTAFPEDLPTELQEATVTIKRCNGALLEEDQDGHVCASGRSTTGCFGDSGGPLLRRDRVVAVFSYVSLDCSPAPKYAVYTRVSSVVDWIDRTVMVRCQGLAPTVRLGRGEMPTEGSDVIIGTAGNDVILGLGGDDVICGLGGNDVILGGPGNDRIRGNRGADYVAGGDGDDLLMGNRGRDRLHGGDGTDRCHDGAGRDKQLACE